MGYKDRWATKRSRPVGQSAGASRNGLDEPGLPSGRNQSKRLQELFKIYDKAMVCFGIRAGDSPALYHTRSTTFTRSVPSAVVDGLKVVHGGHNDRLLVALGTTDSGLQDLEHRLPVPHSVRPS